MSPFSSKELYIMNGGVKFYIHKDGFGDVYNATVAEEAEWAKEVIDRSLKRIETDGNATSFKGAVDNLLFHKYPDLESLFLKKMEDATPLRQLFFATALWKISKHEDSFEIVFRNLVQHRSECLDEVFLSLGDFEHNLRAKKFILFCFEGDDDELRKKANITIATWAYSGMPLLRQNNLLERLASNDRSTGIFKVAVLQLKQILEVV